MPRGGQDVGWSGHVRCTLSKQEIMQTESMAVTGMKCSGCPIKLSLALNGVTGVEDVQVSLASGEVTVRYDERLTSPPQLKAAVIGTGFGFDGIPATDGHDPRPNYCG
jgi:copper chaperone CopZ